MSLLARFVVVGLLLAGVAAGWWRLTAHYERKGYNHAQAEYTAAALLASEAARAKEQALQTQVEKVAHDYQNEKRRRAADAVATAGKLSELQAALNGIGADTAATSGTDDPRADIISECAVALVGLDSYAKTVAGTASALQSYARDVCVSK